MWRNIQKKWQRQSESKNQLDENYQKIHTTCEKGDGPFSRSCVNFLLLSRIL